MHPLLQPVFPIRFAALSGAVWLAWTVGAVIVHINWNNAPAAAVADLAVDPPPHIVRTIAIPRRVPFEERWMPPPVDPPVKVEPPPAPLPKPAPKPVIEVAASEPHHAERHRDSVCGDRGRRYYYKRHHYLSWRCRR